MVGAVFFRLQRSISRLTSSNGFLRSKPTRVVVPDRSETSTGIEPAATGFLGQCST